MVERLTDPRPAAEEVLEGLFGRIAPRVFGRAADLLEGEVTFSRIIALFHLYRYGPQTVAALAEAAKLSPTAGSRMVDGLVSLGVLSRSESSTDRRRKDVALTAEGRTAVTRLRHETGEAFAELLSGAPVELLADLSSALTALDAWLVAQGRDLAVPGAEPSSKI